MEVVGDRAVGGLAGEAVEGGGNFVEDSADGAAVEVDRKDFEAGGVGLLAVLGGVLVDVRILLLLLLPSDIAMKDSPHTRHGNIRFPIATSRVVRSVHTAGAGV